MSNKTLMPVRVMVVGEDLPTRSRLIAQLSEVGTTIVGETEGGAHALELTRRLRPDLILLDARRTPVDGVEVAAKLSRAARVLVMAPNGDGEIARSAVRNGARLIRGGRSVDELGQVVCEAARQADPDPETAGAALGLSVREVEVMGLIARGLSNNEIARTLFLAEKTVKNHINRIYAKLGTDSRRAAITLWHHVLAEQPVC
ncbi:MAG: LuxR C-terminal-related transcriptional regulator [Nocardioidaceae bacterium]